MIKKLTDEEKEPIDDSLPEIGRLMKIEEHYNANLTFTHELSHAYDCEVVNSWSNKEFSKNVALTSVEVAVNIDKYSASEINKHHMFIQDIFSALSNGEIKTNFHHSKEYWDKNEFNVKAEIFANLATLKANKIEIPCMGVQFDKMVNMFDEIFGGI